MKWEKKRIREFATVYDGPHATPKESETGPVFLGIKNIRPEGGLNLSEIRHINESEYEKWTKRITPQGRDIVLSYEATLHRYAIIPNDFVGCLGRRMALVRVNQDQVSERFLYYTFLSDSWRGFIDANKLTGATVDRISITDFPNYQVSIPPLPTQRKIASILSAYDDLIENNLKRIKLLEEKAFLRYKSEFDFFKPSNEVNKLPDGWFVKRADEIFKINIGKTPPREQSEWFNDEDSKVKWVSIKDINNSTVFAFETSETVTEMAVNKFNMNVAKANTVLLSFKLTVGKVAITTEDMTTNEAIAHFNIEDESQMCSEYIYFYLKNFPYDSLGSTSSIGTAINSKVVKAMPVLLPPEKVINNYKNEVYNDFNLIQNLLKQNTKLREARDILLPKLMNGQIEV
jgi:type I restriction enzyme S subunit